MLTDLNLRYGNLNWKNPSIGKSSLVIVSLKDHSYLLCLSLIKNNNKITSNNNSWYHQMILTLDKNNGLVGKGLDLISSKTVMKDAG
jgi:hypothetical protein